MGLDLAHITDPVSGESGTIFTGFEPKTVFDTVIKNTFSSEKLYFCRKPLETGDVQGLALTRRTAHTQFRANPAQKNVFDVGNQHMFLGQKMCFCRKPLETGGANRRSLTRRTAHTQFRAIPARKLFSYFTK